MSKQELQAEIAALLGEESSEASVEEDAGKSTSGSSPEGGASTPEGGAPTEDELETEGGEEAGWEEGAEEEEPPAEPEPSKEESEELKALRAELAELKAKMNGEPSETASPGEESAPAMPELKAEAVEIDLFGGKKYDEIMEDEGAFTEWAKNLTARVQEATQESIYKKLPQVIQAYAEQQLEVKSRAKDFYTNHPDLAEHKAEVAKSANLIAQAEPGLDYDQFFKKVADHARYMLGIDGKKTKGDGKEENGKKPSKPALNNKSAKSNSRSAAKAPDLSGIEKDITDMLEQIDQ